MEPTVQVHCVGFTVDLPEAPCCSLDLCCLPINVVVGDVNMHSYLVLQVTIFTACLCSVTLIFKVLFVSPMYTLLQSLQGTWYTTSFFSSGIFCFTLSYCFRVFSGLKTTFTPRSAQALSNLSLRPRTSTADTLPPLCRPLGP